VRLLDTASIFTLFSVSGLKDAKLINKKDELSQRRPRDTSNIWVPRKISRVLTTPMATFPEICRPNGLLFRSILRMCAQNLKFVALSVPEIIGSTPKIWAVRGYDHAPFSPILQRASVRMGPLNILAKFEVRSFTVSGIIGGTPKIWAVHAPFSPYFASSCGMSSSSSPPSVYV